MTHCTVDVYWGVLGCECEAVCYYMLKQILGKQRLKYFFDSAV